MPSDRDDDDRDDRDEDYRRRAKRRRRDADDEDLACKPTKGGGLIPYRNGMALASYYCGVFSIIPLFWVSLSILAIIFGFLGLNKAKVRPEMGGKGHSITGIVLGIITILLPICIIVAIYLLR